MNLEHYIVFFQRENKDPLQISLPSDFNKVIAVDGGLNDVLALGLKADLFVGDCDSVNHDLHSMENVTIYAQEKDFLDGEGALEYLKTKQFDKLTFVSFFQGRWDMSFTHFLSLIHYKEFANKLEILCQNSKMFYFTESFRLSGIPGQKFSIIPLDKITQLSIDGAKYNLQEQDISLGRGFCLSNHFENETIFVQWSDQGPLLLELFDFE
ncbi:thiamine diphosphokinase [bacterium]|nr:thiamine diphosphokinase [bacterium]